MNIDNITQQEVDNFKELIRLIKRLSSDGITRHIENQVLNLLDFSFPFFSHLVMRSEFPKIVRLTVNRRVLGNNNRVTNINHLKCCK
jgi:hypothetical protein